MLKKLSLPVITAALVFGGASAHAEMNADQLKALIQKANEYGFTYYTEIDIDDDMSAEIEGWVDATTYAEVQFSATGDKVGEKRKEKKDPYGLSHDALQNTLRAAAANGLVSFESIDVSKRGHISVEGYTADKKRRKSRCR